MLPGRTSEKEADRLEGRLFEFGKGGIISRVCGKQGEGEVPRSY